MAPPLLALVASNLLAALLAGALAIVVHRTTRERPNPWLLGVLVAQAVGSLVFALAAWRTDLAAAVPMVLAMEFTLVAMGITFLLFSARLETPLARPLRTRLGRALLVAIAVGVLLPTLLRLARSQPVSLGETDDAPWIFLGNASLLALVFSVHAWRRTPRESPLRRRAAAFAAAFGTRDGVLFATITAWGLADAGVLPAGTKGWLELSNGFNTMLFVTLLTYGILSTRLFDIDLRIKWGISRGTAASMFVGGFFAAYKIAENFLGREIGWIFGGALSGIFFFLAPRLNKLADTVANAAMPKVQPTSEYVSYKKLEVYRAAVESALEGDGEIDPKERAMLDRLRAKLGLKESDARELEAELVPSG